MNKLKKIFNNRFVLYGLGIILLILLWEIIAFATDQLFLPEFFQCLSEAFLLLINPTTYAAIGYTLLRLFIALIFSTIGGVILGTIAGYYNPIAKILSPLITVLKAIPTVAIILLLIVFVPNASIYVVSMILFPIIYQATLEGINKNYQQYEMIIHLKGKNHISNLTNILMPLSLNYILLGIIQSLSLGLKVQIMAETFSYTSSTIGLGMSIYQAYSNVDFKLMMAYVLLVIIISLLMDGILYLVKGKIERKLGIYKRDK